MKAKKKKESNNDDFLAKEAAEAENNENGYTLDIPDDEIWTYQIEGLQAPYIGKEYKNAGRNKFIVVLTLIIAIGLSIYFSVRAVHSNVFEYKKLEDGTYELVKFSNPGDIKEITIDYVVVDTDTGEKDMSKPITVIHEYAFNCDETLDKITFGKDVRSIDGKSIYSCWYITYIEIDKANANYCDVDGVIYSKDMKQLVFYPNDHDKYLRKQNGYDNLLDDAGKPMEELWGTTERYNEAFYQKYNRDVRTYVVPSTVETLGELSLAYSNIVDLYLPEGLTSMENMANFKNTVLTNIYSYRSNEKITDTTYKAIDQMSVIYSSLPEGLKFIGSDCMYYTRGLSYMYIPSSVETIKHHTFWSAVYKEKDGSFTGIPVMNVATDKETFSKCETGDQWLPEYKNVVFNKKIEINYSAERESRTAANIKRQYYWAVQWVINHTDSDGKELVKYLVRDFDNNGIPELVLRTFDKTGNTTVDTVYTFNYGYIDDFNGPADYEDGEMAAITDETMLNEILTTVK